MSDLLQQVTDDQDPIKKILNKVPGFSGYIERQSRRDADKLLRETIAQRFEELWQRVSNLQQDLLSSGGLMYVDDMENAAIKLRTFADRIRTASYGHSSLFEAVKIGEEELAQLYAYDNAMLDLVEQVGAAIDNVEASIGTDGLPAAIRHLTTLARECVNVFDKRREVILGGAGSDAPAA
ncbi:MAG: hypothetical protein D6755_04985 [Anaerolineae bacterium]|nr:MAG: hypothetical protein D6755_04985 [Anaerolineae bacterium]